MSIWSYPTLAHFKNARIGDKVITFDDLRREMNFEQPEESYHTWIAHKDKKDYLILHDSIGDLPIKLKSTKVVTDKSKIYHFVEEYSHIGFTPERRMGFRELIDGFFDVQHTNKQHFTLFKLLAITAYITRINTRICSNPEFGKDSTFEVLNYLTNSVAVFDKPRTMAKLEYGVVNKVLMVNELVPKSEDEKRIISEFLLSIGSLKPVYQKTSRGSAAFATKDSYNIENLSLIICYNSMQDVSEKDKDSYFDVVFGNNIKERFMPFKFTGRLDVEQFAQSPPYSVDIDTQLMGFARTIEWYRQNYESELKPYTLNLERVKIPGRQKHSFKRIVEFIGLYAKDEAEFAELVNLLLECHYAYVRMATSTNLISDYEGTKIKITSNTDELKPIGEVEEVKDDPIAWLRNRKDCEIEDFVKEYGEDTFKRLMAKGDVFCPKNHIVAVLE